MKLLRGPLPPSEGRSSASPVRSEQILVWLHYRGFNGEDLLQTLRREMTKGDLKSYRKFANYVPVVSYQLITKNSI